MARKSRLEMVENEVVAFFDSLPKKAFGYNEVAEILSSKRDEWNLPANVYTSKFIDFLTDSELLRKIKLNSKSYSPLDRYLWRNPSIYAIAQSVKKTGYLSHGSAVFLNGLTISFRKLSTSTMSRVPNRSVEFWSRRIFIVRLSESKDNQI